MTILLSSPVHVQSSPSVAQSPAPSSFATHSAWLLGHALGLHSEISSPPSGYSSEEAAAFRKGWALGARSRRPSLGDPGGPLPYVAQSSEDESLWAAMSHGDSHDGLPDPFAIELWSQTPGDFFDAEREREEQGCTEEDTNWAMGRLLAPAMIGGEL